MTGHTTASHVSTSTRRDFLQASATAAGGVLAAALPLASTAHAAGGDLLRVGLIGCGGRGTGAAAQALNADQNVKLVSMADVFEDRLQSSLAELKSDEKVAGKV